MWLSVLPGNKSVFVFCSDKRDCLKLWVSAQIGSVTLRKTTGSFHSIKQVPHVCFRCWYFTVWSILSEPWQMHRVRLNRSLKRMVSRASDNLKMLFVFLRLMTTDMNGYQVCVLKAMAKTPAEWSHIWQFYFYAPLCCISSKEPREIVNLAAWWIPPRVLRVLYWVNPFYNVCWQSCDAMKVAISWWPLKRKCISICNDFETTKRISERVQ